MPGLFKKKNGLTEEQIKWNKLCDLWAEEKLESPYQELMTYQSEINNGGHSQYFTNIENYGDIEKEMSVLHRVLSPELRINLQQAYQAYLILCEKEDKSAEEAIAR